MRGLLVFGCMFWLCTANGQNPDVQVQNGRRGYFAELAFSKGVSALRVSGICIDKHGLDTFGSFQLKLFSQRDKIQRLWLHPHFVIWEDQNGQKHTAPYTYFHKLSHKKGRYWAIRLHQDESTTSWIVKDRSHAFMDDQPITWQQKLKDSMNIGFSGQVIVEGQVGSALYRENRELPTSIRVYGEQHLSARYVPLTLRYGLSTEHSSHNNLNYITVEFNEEELLRQLQKAALPAAKQKVDTLNAEVLLQEQRAKIENQVVTRFDVEQQRLQDSIDIWKGLLQDSLQAGKNEAETGISDSLKRMQNQYRGKVQKAEVAINDINHKKDSVEDIYTSAMQRSDSLKTLATKAHESLDEILSNPCRYMENQVVGLSLPTLPKKLLRLDHLKIGKHFLFSESLIGPIPVNGLSAGLRSSSGSSFFISRSRSHSSQRYGRFFSPSSSDVPVQNIWAAGLTLPIATDVEFSLGWISAADTSATGRNTYGLASVNIEKKKWAFNSEYVANYNALKASFWPIENASFASSSLLELDIANGHLKPYGKMRHFDLEFQNIGYLRVPSGFTEFSTGIKSHAWNGKLKMNMFYSYIHQNRVDAIATIYKFGSILTIKPSQGFSATISYLPVGEMNRNPNLPEFDDMLKTDVLNGHFQFTKKVGNGRLSQMMVFQQYSSSFQDQLTSQRTYSSRTNWQFGSGSLLGYQFTYLESTQPNPHIPMYGHQVTHNFKVFKQWFLSYQIAHNGFTDGYNIRTSCQLNGQVKSFQLGIQLTYDVVGHTNLPYSSPVFANLRLGYRY